MFVRRIVNSKQNVTRVHRHFLHSSSLIFLRLGDIAPNFVTNSTEGTIDFHKWIGNEWALLVSHPKDFTPVCTTELAELGKLYPQFQNRNVKCLALSAENAKKHAKWAKDVVEFGNLPKLPFAILDDESRTISEAYDMIDKDNINEEDSMPLTVRSVYLIDPDKKIRLITTYPASTGRYWPEILRCIDSIQLSEKHPIATPHGWRPGDDVVVTPDVSTEEAKKRYPNVVNVVKPYLRIIPQPE